MDKASEKAKKETTYPCIKKKRNICVELKKQWQSQAMVIPGIIFIIIFSYLPLYGIVAAFKDFEVYLGFFESPWATNELGQLDLFKYFKQFMLDDMFWHAMRNTVIINVLGLIFSFPAPIIFALLLSEIQNKGYRKFVQTISYMPYFISWLVFGGLIMKLLDPSMGPLGQLLIACGAPENYYLLAYPDHIYLVAILSGIIKNLGWGAIIYLAALTSVSDELVEAADLEGANRFQKIWYISLPTIKGTVSIYFIFAVSGLLGSNFDQMYMIKNNQNKLTAEVIDTYVYEIGFAGNMDLSYATALGLVRSAVSFILLLIANFMSKKISGNGLY